MFVTRSQWGAISTDRTPMPGALAELVIHHVAGQLPQGIAAEFAHMRQLQIYAIDSKGYQDIDYNLVIGPSGNVYEARGIWSKSAATLDRNNVSRSVCAMGNYERDTPTEWLLEGIVEAGRMMLEQGALVYDVKIYGHRDNPAHPLATACPGRNLYPHVPGLAARILQHALAPILEGELMDDIFISHAGAVAILLDTGHKRELGYPTEYELRGSPAGIELSAEQWASIPDYQS